MIPPQAIAAGVIAVVAGAAGWTLNGWRMGTTIAELEATHAKIVAEAEKTARAEVDKVRAREDALTAKIQEITDEGRATNERLQAAIVAGSTASRGVLDAARIATNRCASSQNPAPAGGGKAANVPSSMSDGDRLLRVLGELDGAAGAYAEAADRSRSAGLACERYVEALKP